MIHSLSGGELKQNNVYNFVKVKILDKQFLGKTCFYISNIPYLKVSNIVLVPFGYPEKQVKAIVERIDKNINEQVAPIPIKRMKYIIKKLS